MNRTDPHPQRDPLRSSRCFPLPCSARDLVASAGEGTCSMRPRCFFEENRQALLTAWMRLCAVAPAEAGDLRAGDVRL